MIFMDGMPKYLRDGSKIYVNIRTWYTFPLNVKFYEYASNYNLNDRIIINDKKQIMFRCLNVVQKMQTEN
jgi:hypothetical protein